MLFALRKAASQPAGALDLNISIPISISKKCGRSWRQVERGLELMRLIFMAQTRPLIDGELLVYAGCFRDRRLRLVIRAGGPDDNNAAALLFAAISPPQFLSPAPSSACGAGNGGRQVCCCCLLSNSGESISPELHKQRVLCELPECSRKSCAPLIKFDRSISRRQATDGTTWPI